VKERGEATPRWGVKWTNRAGAEGQELWPLYGDKEVVEGLCRIYKIAHPENHYEPYEEEVLRAPTRAEGPMPQEAEGQCP